MEKPIFNKSGMKQIINSGWKTFDKQTNLICEGNLIANTQYSDTIRPYKETECDVLTFEEGELMKFDLKPFYKYPVPHIIKDILEDENRTEEVYLYMFFVRDRRGIKEPFCFAVTTMNHKLIEHMIIAQYGTNYQKRLGAAKCALKYITD